MTEWKVKDNIVRRAGDGLRFIRSLYEQFDTSKLLSVSIDSGPSDNCHLGVWGVCHYPYAKRSGFTISCHANMLCVEKLDRNVRMPPIYVDYETAVSSPNQAAALAKAKLGPDERLGPLCWNMSDKKAWFRVIKKIWFHTWSEGLVWVAAHEMWHWLRRSRQVPGWNIELEADQCALWVLEQFRNSVEPAAVAAILRAGTWKQESSNRKENNEIETQSAG